MITIILIEPENPGNTGAILRIMKNFDFDSIILINPQFNIKKSEYLEELKNRAKWGKDLIKKIIIKKYNLKKIRKEFNYLVATTAKIGSDYNLLRTPITAEQFSEKISRINKETKIGILIGRESIGLKNEEIMMCDFVVTIPASKKYSTLNVSHATAIILYELFKKQKNNSTSHITPISNKEKQQIEKMINKILNNINFSTKEKRETQKVLWKKILGKSMLSKREAYALMGFLRKIQNKIIIK